MLSHIVVSFAGALEGSAARRNELKPRILEHGGEISYIVSDRVTHILVGEEDFVAAESLMDTSDLPVKRAKEFGAMIISEMWLAECIKAGELVDASKYSVHVPCGSTGSGDVESMNAASRSANVPERSALDKKNEAGVPKKKKNWAAELRARMEKLRQQRRLEKEQQKRAEKEKLREEKQALQKRQEESDQDWKSYKKQKENDRREDQRAMKLARFEANWEAERQRIQARAREKRKEKVINSILWERKATEERNKDLRNIQRAGDTMQSRLQIWEEWEKKKTVWRRQEAFELGRKIFIGGLNLDDLKDESEAKKQFISDRRKTILRSALASFGEILGLREQWQKQYIFVIYKDREDATRAYEIMHNLEWRKAMEENVKRKLLESGEPTEYAPPSTFYVRWPRQKYGRKQETEADQKRAEIENERKAKKERRKQERKERKKKEREERKAKRKAQRESSKQEGSAQPKKSKPKPTTRTVRSDKRKSGHKNADEKKIKHKPGVGGKDERKAKQEANKEGKLSMEERIAKREREREELRSKTLEELEDMLDNLRCGRRDLIRGWRRGWETPFETRRWQRILFEKMKKKRRLEIQAERLRQRQQEAERRRTEKREAKRKRMEEERQRLLKEQMNQAQEEIRRRKLIQDQENERWRQLRDQAAKEREQRRRQINEQERQRVRAEIAQLRTAVRLQKNRRRRMRKRERARKDSLMRPAELFKSYPMAKMPIFGGGLVTPCTVQKDDSHPPLTSLAPLDAAIMRRSKRDDTWVVLAFGLLCGVIFVSSMYI